MKSNSRFILLSIIGLSILIGGYEAIMYANGFEISQGLHFIYGAVFLVLLALWVHEDSKTYPNIYRPFEYGYLVFIFYIPYIPYYLIKTRGWLLGIGLLTGLFILYNTGYFLVWIIYFLD